MDPAKTVKEAARDVPVVSTSDVIVVGGGSAGLCAAVSASRNGAKVTLVERYPHLGGMASGGMVLVLDDMCNGQEITTQGLVIEFVERLKKLGLAVYPPVEDRNASAKSNRKWLKWGCYDVYDRSSPRSVVFAAAFDPDGWKRVSLDLIEECGIDLRLHSFFSEPIIENGDLKGIIVETKTGRQALLGSVVIDASGDLDIGFRAGVDHVQGGYIVTTVFRLGGVDTDRAQAFEFDEPERFAATDREIRRILRGAWSNWWLKTPLPGIVWCNCPHMTGYDGISVEHLTAAEFDGRKRVAKLYDFVRGNVPGFENCFMLGEAEQIGVRQTRLLKGEYIVTKEDVLQRRHFEDSVCRGRDYYTPYRSLLPVGIENLIVAGRHYSSAPDAQRISREIPPCMAQGEAAGIAAALSLHAGIPVRKVNPKAIQRQMRRQGADPGDQPSANANLQTAATWHYPEP